METEIQVGPTGACWCGCGAQLVNPQAFFKAGHDKKADSMLTELLYGSSDGVALRLAVHGYGPSGGKNLLQDHKAVMADWSRRRIDVLALTTLRELAGRTNVALAVVFTAPEGVPWKPSQGPDGGPEPSITSVLQVPMLGSVVAQGFFGSLSEDQKHLVEKRFPGRTAVWSRTS